MAPRGNFPLLRSKSDKFTKCWPYLCTNNNGILPFASRNISQFFKLLASYFIERLWCYPISRLILFIHLFFSYKNLMTRPCFNTVQFKNTDVSKHVKNYLPIRYIRHFFHFPLPKSCKEAGNTSGRSCRSYYDFRSWPPRHQAKILKILDSLDFGSVHPFSVHQD